MVRISAVLLLILSVNLGGCRSDTMPATTPTTAGTSQPAALTTAVPTPAPRVTTPAVPITAVNVGVQVTMAQPPFLPGCSETEVAAALEHFLLTFNAGDQATLSQLFPAPSSQDPRTNDFRVYGVSAVPGGPDTFVAASRAQLLPYLAQRHAAHEVLQLVSLGYSPSWAPDRVDLTMTVTRRADDVPTRTLPAKGVLVCSTHQLIVWNM